MKQLQKLILNLMMLQQDLVEVYIYVSGLQIIKNLHQYNESINLFERALAINQNCQYSLKGKAECLRLLGKWEEALFYYQMVLDQNPNQHRALFFQIDNRKRTIGQLSKVKQVLKEHESNLQINPKCVKSMFGKGLVCQYIS